MGNGSRNFTFIIKFSCFQSYLAFFDSITSKAYALMADCRFIVQSSMKKSQFQTVMQTKASDSLQNKSGYFCQFEKVSEIALSYHKYPKIANRCFWS